MLQLTSLNTTIKDITRSVVTPSEVSKGVLGSPLNFNENLTPKTALDLRSRSRKRVLRPKLKERFEGSVLMSDIKEDKLPNIGPGRYSNKKKLSLKLTLLLLTKDFLCYSHELYVITMKIVIILNIVKPSEYTNGLKYVYSEYTMVMMAPNVLTT